MNSITFRPNGKNRTPDVVKALLHAPDNTVVRFEEGVYDFYREGTYNGYFFPGCNRSGEKQVVFPLLNLNNITIEGNGADFVFHDRVFPFILQNCTNVTLRDFSVDFSFPRCLEAVVTRMDNNGFALKITNGAYSVGKQGNLLIQAGAETFSSSERRFFLEQRDWHCFISVGNIYYENVDLPADVIYCSAEEQGDEVYFRYTDDTAKARFTLNKRLMLSYDEMRENDVIFMERCKDTVLQNVRILHGAGMGVVGQCCENLHLDHYVVDPDDDGLYSTTADAILLTNFSGKVVIENSRVDRSIDDAISIHGFYTRVERITDRNKAVVRLVHPSQAGTNIYFEGDTVKISDGETMNEHGRLTVKRSCIREFPEQILLEFREDIDGKLNVGDFLENDRRTPEVEIRNNVFMNFPAIRLSSAQKTVFENNVIKNCTALDVNDLMRYWSVSGCVNDLTIRNNTFENMQIAVNIVVDRFADSAVRHRNIRITDNRFCRCEKGIEAHSVNGLTIKNNIFEDTPIPVTVHNCENVDADRDVFSQ